MTTPAAHDAIDGAPAVGALARLTGMVASGYGVEIVLSGGCGGGHSPDFCERPLCYSLATSKALIDPFPMRWVAAEGEISPEERREYQLGRIRREEAGRAEVAQA